MSGRVLRPRNSVIQNVYRPMSRRNATSPSELVPPASPSQQSRHKLRSMWELASVLGFINIFWPILELDRPISPEDLEDAILEPNTKLDDLHVALLKEIPWKSEVELSRQNWVTFLLQKLKQHWHLGLQGPYPFSENITDVEAAYKELDPSVRVDILKLLCEICLEQDNFRTFVNESLKDPNQITIFRKECFAASICGANYWCEEDHHSGYRLYRELSNKQAGYKGQLMPTMPRKWETIASSLFEFHEVVNILSASRSPAEVDLAKEITSRIIPQVEALEKKRENSLKQQRKLGCFLDQGIAGGRSLRNRKPVTSFKERLS